MILHISNAFLGSKVHRNLYSSLDKIGVDQLVYTVIRNYKEPKRENLIEFVQECSQIIVAKTTLKTYHRFLFRQKINILYKDLYRSVDLTKIKVTHATTLFTDGAIAYKVYKEFGVPYIVTIRNTDVNYFLKLRPDLLPLARKIILNARFVTFLSPGLKDNFFNHWFMRSFRDRVESKLKLIYNGIEDFWLENVNRRTIPNQNLTLPDKLLFVGRVSTEKNLSLLIGVILVLRKKYPSLTLDIVGPWGNDKESVVKLIEGNSDVVRYLGEIKQRENLLTVYRNHDIFVMPSTKESFGLVYLEALTQGLPVLFTKGQGFDGVLREKIGECVVSSNIADVERGLNNLIKDYPIYLSSNIDFEQFRWDKIASDYQKLYDVIDTKK